jgi:hypothetical protein
MKLAAHLAAVLVAILTLWSMRHEYTEKATPSPRWAIPPALAVVVAAILLIVSPGKRFELWTVGIAAGFAIGLVMGTTPRAIKDHARGLVRIDRAWDGLGAAALLLLLTLARVVTSDLMDRPSGNFGVLGAAAAFLAAYLVGRGITLHFYTARRSLHLDMVRGQGRSPDY